jgi:hypothetical protein
MTQPSLEDLLSEDSNRTFNIKSNSATEARDNSIQTAQKNASLYDFIKMIQKIVTVGMKDSNTEFLPDEGAIILKKHEEKIDHPFITYKLISRSPKDELKPRHRQTVEEKTYDKIDERIGEIHGQKFKCLLQFNIFASVYDTAEQVMERFEELIFTYTGYFKKNGVAEILFREQLTDEKYNSFRETMSVRNLVYYVEVEKLFVIFQEKIKDIETYGSLEKEA